MRRLNSRQYQVLSLTLVVVPLLAFSCANLEEQKPPSQDSESHAARPEADGATCPAHGDPAELCFICDGDLRDPGRLWCREHDRYEDRCWLCHPELEEKDRLWCKEHSLYEDECFLCHPELLDEASVPVEETTADSGLFCNEHGVPEIECGICHPELLTQEPGHPGLKVRLGSSTSAAEAGVVVQAAGVLPMDSTVPGFAELMFNQNRLAKIKPLVGGVVRAVEVDLGSRVEEGDLLVTLTSETIGEAEGAYLRALADEELHRKTRERERDLLAQGISSEKAYQEEEAAHLVSVAAAGQARQRLVVLGFAEAQIGEIVDRRMMTGVLELRAPFDGEIVQRQAVQGEVVDAHDLLFTIADPSDLWAMVNLPESQLSHVRTGQKVELTVESLPGQSFAGTLTWVSATVDKRTRMAHGRIEVQNPGGRLKANMFAHARIATARSDRAVVVPVSAVQDVAGTPIVFVRFADDLFEARPVTLGTKHDGRIEITHGLNPDEPVVVAGGFALKSQLLVSRLGAGCAHD